MDPEYTKTLKRQIQKYLSDRTITPDLLNFLSAVDGSYKQFDRDRDLVERALDLTSAELVAAYEKIRDEKKVVLEKLSDNEQILKSIDENLSEAVFRINEEGIIHFANQAFSSMFELEVSDQLPGQSIEYLFMDADGWNDFKSNFDTSGIKKNAEIQMKTKFGEQRWVLMSMVKVKKNEKDYVYDGSIVNITHQKEIEQDLKEALEKEKELGEMKSRFVSMTSHEFRTPLTTIQANAEILSIKIHQKPAISIEKIQMHLIRITTEVARLTKLMNDILVIGRLESGKIIFDPVDVDLKSLINDLIQERDIDTNDDRTIKFSCSGEERSFFGDPNLLRHAISNLISNAFKYSKGSSSPEIQLSFRNEKINIVVKDFGMGIPKEEQASLFDSFFRATNVSNIQGTGLGLIIVKQFIEIHHGIVTVESALNEGTRVTLEFPHVLPVS